MCGDAASAGQTAAFHVTDALRHASWYVDASGMRLIGSRLETERLRVGVLHLQLHLSLSRLHLSPSHLHSSLSHLHLSRLSTPTLVRPLPPPMASKVHVNPAHGPGTTFVAFSCDGSSVLPPLRSLQPLSSPSPHQTPIHRRSGHSGQNMGSRARGGSGTTKCCRGYRRGYSVGCRRMSS